MDAQSNLSKEEWKVAFNIWMTEVDKELMKLTDGLAHMDLADWSYADAFDSGVEPAEAAEAVLEENTNF